MAIVTTLLSRSTISKLSTRLSSSIHSLRFFSTLSASSEHGSDPVGSSLTSPHQMNKGNLVPWIDTGRYICTMNSLGLEYTSGKELLDDYVRALATVVGSYFETCGRIADLHMPKVCSQSRGHTTRTPWGCTKGFCTAVDIPNDSWTILALLEKFGCQWWIGTCDGVAFNDSSEFGHYLMCYKKVGRVYLECRVHWGYKAVTAEAHNQILSELNAFLLLLQTARKKNVKYLIIRSDSESAVDIVTTIWKKDSVNFATRKQKAGFPSLLRMIHKEMRFLWNFVCIHIHKDNNLLANAISRLPTHMKYLQPPIDARKVKRADPLCEVNFEGMLFEKLHMVFCEQR